jgi:hypothetical protein
MKEVYICAPPAACFIVNWVCEQLHTLDPPCSCKLTKSVHPGSMHIIVATAEHCTVPETMLMERYVVIQTHATTTPDHRRLLASARRVYALTLTVASSLAKEGIVENVHPLNGLGPVRAYRGYFPTNGRLPRHVVFHGAMSERRRRCLAELQRGGLPLMVLPECGGPHMAAFLAARARVVVNIHANEGDGLDHCYLLECESLGIPVVSESDGSIHPLQYQRVRFVSNDDDKRPVSEMLTVLRDMYPVASRVFAAQQPARFTGPESFAFQLQSFTREMSVEPGFVKTGVVVTTHGDTGVYASMCVNSLRRHIQKPRMIVLFINKSDDPIHEEMEALEDVVVRRVDMSLTDTWNDGIRMCHEAHCNVVILSNNDLFVDGSVQSIVDEAGACPLDVLRYYGPLTNNPGHAECNQGQLGHEPAGAAASELLHGGEHTNLNGFFMCFPMHVLRANMHDESHFFDPGFPWGGNETEWFRRLVQKGGAPYLVPKTFVYHYKLKSWRNSEHAQGTDVCLYTINTGGYEADVTYRGDMFGDECDMLYFSDESARLRHATQMGWTPMYVTSDHGEAKLLQRTVKTLAYRFLPQKYATSIYLDGNAVPSFSSVPQLLQTTDADAHDMVCWFHPHSPAPNGNGKHPVRYTVRDEVCEVIKKNLETRDHLAQLLKRQDASGYAQDNGVVETSVLIRKHHSLKRFSEEWRDCIAICRRDQISFDWLVWKHAVNALKLPCDARPMQKHKHSGDISNRVVYEKNKNILV